jgi:hypothetical protein
MVSDGGLTELKMSNPRTVGKSDGSVKPFTGATYIDHPKKIGKGFTDRP